MRVLFIVLNLIAAGAVVLGGHIICSVHRVHSFSMFVELENRGALAKPLRPVSPDDPVGPDGALDVAKRLETIGGLDGNLPGVTYSAAVIFLLNALAFFTLCTKKAAPASSS